MAHRSDWVTRDLEPRVVRRTLAAVVAMTILVASVVYVRGRRSAHNDVQRYRTDVGQIVVAGLGDGNRAVLAPRTTLHVTTEHGVRVATLHGQVQFLIADTAPPFEVRAEGITVRAHGAIFDIRRYDDDVDAQVVALHGTVVAHGQHALVTVTPGMMTRISDSAVAPVATVDTAAVTGWMQGRLIFQDTPISSVLATLDRWYRYEFRLADSALGVRHVTITLPIGTLSETIDRLHTLLGVTATVEDSVVTIK